MSGMHPPRGERWIDEAAGPIVRPYAMTRGRTRPRGEPLDVVTILVATGRPVPERVRVSPEQHHLLYLCRRPQAVADLASEVGLPLGVVGVLLGDLIDHALLETQPELQIVQPDQRLLRRVLDDLRAL
jgi:hypothetical protein